MEFPPARFTTYISSIISSRLKIITESRNKNDIEIHQRSVFYDTDLNEDVDIQFRKSTFYIADIYGENESTILQPYENIYSCKHFGYHGTHQIVSIDEDSAWETISNSPQYANIHNLQGHQIQHDSIDDTSSYNGSFWSDDTDIEIGMNSDEELLLLQLDEYQKDDVQNILDEGYNLDQNSNQIQHIANISVNEKIDNSCINKSQKDCMSLPKSNNDLENSVSIVMNNNISLYLDNPLITDAIGNSEDKMHDSNRIIVEEVRNQYNNGTSNTKDKVKNRNTTITDIITDQFNNGISKAEDETDNINATIIYQFNGEISTIKDNINRKTAETKIIRDSIIDGKIEGEDETDNQCTMITEIISSKFNDFHPCSLKYKPKQKPVPPPKPKKKPVVPPKPEQTQTLSWNFMSPLSLPAERYFDHFYMSNYELTSNVFLEDSLEHNIEQPMYNNFYFNDEPLYQFYESNTSEEDADIEHDYECTSNGYYAPADFLQRRLSAMNLVTPPDGQRRLWCELPEVIQSGVLGSMSTANIKLQEAMFEVITSEASYLKSLYVLISHFVYCPDLMVEDVEDPLLTHRQKKDLFSSIIPVKRCSEQFLADLEKRWQESVKISSLSDIIIKHVRSQFSVYIKYCTHQIHQERTLKELKSTNKHFAEILSSLESSKICQSQSLHSFLILPMQRITRLPLLLAAIIKYQVPGSEELEETEQAFIQLNKIVKECNESMRKIEQMEEMLTISQQLSFQLIRAFPIMSASRHLEKLNDFTRLTWLETEPNSITSTKIFKEEICILLFNDHLIITKGKKENQYVVLDHCPRNMVRMLAVESGSSIVTGSSTIVTAGNVSATLPLHIQTEYKHLIIMTIVQNHEDKISEMVLACSSKLEQEKWVEKLSPFLSKTEDEVVYQKWDLPLVQVTYPYDGNQDGGMSLTVSDVYEVHKMRSNGWYEGKRITDDFTGWFPVSYTEEILSQHMRAKHLWQRYHLVAASGSLLEQKQRERQMQQQEDKKKVRKKNKEFHRSCFIKKKNWILL